MNDDSQHAGHGHNHEHGQGPGAAPPQGDTRPVDPVCAMKVSPESPRRFAFEGVTYFFCSDGCLKKFSAEPGKYLEKLDSRLRGNDVHAGGNDVQAPPADAQATYTCPMHPEIRKIGPGTCPKCGMALEPLMPSATEDDNPELRDFSRRFWWTLPLTIIVTVLAMVGHRWFPSLSATARSWIELVLATPVVLWAAWPFFVRCVASIRTSDA